MGTRAACGWSVVEHGRAVKNEEGTMAAYQPRQMMGNFGVRRLIKSGGKDLEERAELF